MRYFLTASAFLLVTILTSPSNSQVTRVEVDWEIRTLEPDEVAVAPQISLIMANRGDLTSDFAEFRINPEYEGSIGGIKIDTWRGPQELDESAFVSRPPLNQPNDHLRFTTVAEVDGNSTLYRMKNWSSNQWGNIADSEFQTCRTTGNGRISFSIDLTMSESEIEYGHNMVDHIFVREIRYYIGNSLAKRNRTGFYLYRDGQSFVEPETDQEIIDEFIAF